MIFLDEGYTIWHTFFNIMILPMSQQNIEWFFPHGKCESRSSTWTAEAVLQIHCTGRTRIWVVVFKGDLFIPKGWRVSPDRWKGQVFTIPKKVTTTQNCQVGEGKFHELEKSERSSPFLERNEKRVFMKPLWMMKGTYQRKKRHPVDGRNPAPVWRIYIPLFKGILYI